MKAELCLNRDNSISIEHPSDICSCFVPQKLPFHHHDFLKYGYQNTAGSSLKLPEGIDNGAQDKPIRFLFNQAESESRHRNAFCVVFKITNASAC
jgi:hypothetical protein